MQLPISPSNKTIMIPEKRWRLLCDVHPEISKFRNEVQSAIEEPDVIYAGKNDERVAVKELDHRKYLVVIYDEKMAKGELITVFTTKSTDQFDDLRIIWTKNT